MIRPGISGRGVWILVLSATVGLTGVEIARAETPRPNGEAEVTGTTPVELGRVRWERDFEAALKRARKDQRPVLVLFQEVPGCSTCVNYGRQVLSHPLLVEAGETLFTPAAVYNNVKGDDERVLTSFKEEAWNNPVVRIVSGDRTDLAPRLADDYTVGGLAVTMVRALNEAGRTVPSWLQLLANESAWKAGEVQTATLAMHCFWEGEAALGNVPGIVGTMPGFVDRTEVVQVEFNSRQITYATLLEKARGMKCADTVYTHGQDQQKTAAKLLGERAEPLGQSVRPDKAPKYYLAQTPLKFVPMTELQAMRVNAELGIKEDGLGWLSPRQRELLVAIQASPDAGWPVALGADDIVVAWERAQKIAAKTR